MSTTGCGQTGAWPVRRGLVRQRPGSGETVFTSLTCTNISTTHYTANSILQYWLLQNLPETLWWWQVSSDILITGTIRANKNHQYFDNISCWSLLNIIQMIYLQLLIIDAVAADLNGIKIWESLIKKQYYRH